MPNQKSNSNCKKPLLVLTGQYQNGKSTLLNCLLGGLYAMEGKGLVTTKYNTRYSFGDCNMYRGVKDNAWHFFSPGITLEEYEKSSMLEICTYSPLLGHMDLMDSPGSGANDADDSVAEDALKQADFVIFVVCKMLNDMEISFMRKLTAAGKHYSVILNCINDVSPTISTTNAMCRQIYATLNNKNLLTNFVDLSKDHPVYPVNLLWAQCALGYLPAEEQAKKLRKVKDFIDLEEDNISPVALLHASNFLPIRGILENIVTTFFNFTPSRKLDLMKTVSENWTNELKNILEGE